MDSLLSFALLMEPGVFLAGSSTTGAHAAVPEQQNTILPRPYSKLS